MADQKTSEAQKKASMKYIRENLESVSFRVPKGQRDKIHEIAAARGKSLAQYMIDLIEADSGVKIR